MTPKLPERLLADLPLRPQSVAIADAVDNLVVCRTRGGRIAAFIPQVGAPEGHGVDGQERHLFLRNLAVFDDAGACVRKATHELAAPSSIHDLEGGPKGGAAADVGDLHWSWPTAGIDDDDALAGELSPIHGAALAVVELEALSIPAAAFVPTSPGPRFINFGSFIQGLGVHDTQTGAWRQDAGGAVYFLAPVYPPHRGAIIAVDLYIADHSDADGCDVSGRLDRIDRKRTVIELVRMRSRGARGRQDLVHAGIIGYPVDTNADAFHLHVTWQFPPTPHQQDLRLYGARVRCLPRHLEFIGR
ncbi:MAG: hypothetical protein KC486_05725 [Myxococcales bacterium]|nr:hypothetical protein [Myxococcales bacterium]